MRDRLVGPALTLLCALSAPAAPGAKGGPGGQSGAGHAGRGPTGARHSGSSHSGGAHASLAHAPEMKSASGPTTSLSGTASPTPSTGRTDRRDGTSGAGRVDLATSPFLATPSTYAPYFVSPHLSGATGAVRGWAVPYAYSDSGDPACAGPGTCEAPAAADQSLTSSPAALEIVNSGDSGDVRLVVTPSSAQVFVDGAFVGIIDDYRHILAGLNLRAGRHRLEFRAPGYETLAAEVDVDAGRITTYRAELKPLQH